MIINPKPLVPKYTKVIRLTESNVEEVKEFLGKYDQVHPLPSAIHKSNMGIIFKDKAIWFSDFILIDQRDNKIDIEVADDIELNQYFQRITDEEDY